MGKQENHEAAGPPAQEKRGGGPAAPVHVFRARGVRVALFENPADGGGRYYKASLSRVYRDGEEFKTTQSLSRDDLPVAALLLAQAWAWVLAAEARPESRDAEGGVS